MINLCDCWIYKKRDHGDIYNHVSLCLKPMERKNDDWVCPVHGEFSSRVERGHFVDLGKFRESLNASV